jgi:ribonuclease Z
MDLSLFFAGTAGSVPSARRGLPAIVLRRGGDRVLFDCGEGTQRQLVRSIGLADLTHVFLTHHHVDHWLGLPGMLKSFALRARDRPLAIVGPPGTRALLERLRFVYGRLPYELEVFDLELDEEIGWEDWAVVPVAVRHRGPAYGYAIVEQPRPGRFDAELAQRLGVRPGPDFGRLQAGETVAGVPPERVIGPERPGRRIVISGDTAPCDTLRAAALGADVLVHEATFADDEADRAHETLHSTARQAAEVAAECGVKLLALTHVSSRYGGRELRDEAREAFARAHVVRDFDEVVVPLPERGEPELRHWPQDRGPASREPC